MASVSQLIIFPIPEYRRHTQIRNLYCAPKHYPILYNQIKAYITERLQCAVCGRMVSPNLSLCLSLSCVSVVCQEQIVSTAYYIINGTSSYQLASFIRVYWIPVSKAMIFSQLVLFAHYHLLSVNNQMCKRLLLPYYREDSTMSL